MATTKSSSQPQAIQMLRSFKDVAARVDKFFALPNDGEKYLYWRNDPLLRALQDQLGIKPGWINAVDSEGLLDGVTVHQCQWSALKDAFVVNRVQVSDPVFSWNGGSPPAYYQPLANVGKSGAEVVASFLRMFTNNAYLASKGLTEDAITQAMS